MHEAEIFGRIPFIVDAFHNIFLLQRSVISEKYQVFIMFLTMADSQNTLFNMQFPLLKITESCN